MWKSKTLGTSRIAQQRVKGRLQMEALVHSGVDAMVLGDADLALGLDWLGQQARELDLPYVATNFTCEGIAMPSHRLVEVRDLRLGVLGIIGREQAGACTFKAVVPAINASISAMGEVDLVVVLSHQDASAERSMAAAVPAVDVVVNGHSKKTTAAPIALGEYAVQLGAGSRGKKLGVATLRLTEDAKGFRVEREAARLEKQLTRAEERIQKLATSWSAPRAMSPPRVSGFVYVVSSRRRRIRGTHWRPHPASRAFPSTASRIRCGP